MSLLVSLTPGNHHREPAYRPMYTVVVHGYELGAPERANEANKEQGTVAQILKRISQLRCDCEKVVPREGSSPSLGRSVRTTYATHRTAYEVGLSGVRESSYGVSLADGDKPTCKRRDRKASRVRGEIAGDIKRVSRQGARPNREMPEVALVRTSRTARRTCAQESEKFDVIAPEDTRVCTGFGKPVNVTRFGDKGVVGTVQALCLSIVRRMITFARLVKREIASGWNSAPAGSQLHGTALPKESAINCTRSP